MNKHIQGFAHGINQDLSTNKYPNTNVYWAENFRVVSKDGLATGALTNVDGNSKVLSLGNSEERVLELCLIRDTLIAFVQSTEGGKIYKWEHNDSDFETTSPTLIYTHPDLDFITHPIVRAVGRYETPSIQKIYFTDGNSYFKHLNIIPEKGDSYPLTYDIKSLDLVSDVDFSTISLELQTGGNLKAGKIQYAYQLYSKRGSESVFSPASQLIHITESNENQDTFDYNGSEVGTIINKSVQVTVDNPDPLFTRLRLVALEYTVLYQIPNIRIVGEYNIENLDSVTVVDNGSSLGELTLEEFRFLQNDFFPQTLDIKDNYLFAANITNNYFEITDEEFDARVFRADSSDVVTVKNGNNPVIVPHIAGEFTTGLPAFTEESYNDFNDLSLDYVGNLYRTTETRCKYKPGSAGTVLGGKGVNIEYEFTTDQIVLDDSNKSYDYAEGYPRLRVGLSGTYSNHADPFTNKGYQRDEIYRFGIVFFDLKGRQSFVKWIGDIRFPNNQELPFVEYNSTDGKTYANILGIKFSVNIDNISDKISGYRIVRAERTSSDKTIMAQGLIGNPIYAGAAVDNFPEGPYDNYLYPLCVNTTVNDMVAGYTVDTRTTDNYTSGSTVLSGEDLVTGDISRTLLTIDVNKVSLDNRWIEFNSPDVVINKSKLSTSGAYIEVFGYQDEVEHVGLATVRGYEDTTLGDPEERDIIYAEKPRNFGFSETARIAKSSINKFRIFTPKPRGSEGGPTNDATNFVLEEEGQLYNNQGFSPYEKDLGGGGQRIKFGLKGTHSLLTVDNPLELSTNWNTSEVSFFTGNYKVDRGRAQYGGSSYEARSATRYYPASEFISKDTDTTTTPLEVFGGDIYISYFLYARTLYDKERANGYRIETYTFFPVESVINLELRLDPIQDYINWGAYRDIDITDYKIMETVNNGVLNYGNFYPTELGDLYRYNSAYSSIDKSIEYVSKPFDFEDTIIQDTRIYASEKKINGEYIDSWTKFKFNNYIDVDSKHNAITKILTFKNNLFYFQATAVGIASVNERSLIQDNQAKQLSVGTGGILTRYDYITDKSGSEYYDGIIGSDDYMFYVDGRRKRINKLVPGKEVAVSVVKGIDSTLDKLAFENVRVGFDRGYNEVIFAIDNTTVAFNETMDAFSSSYSFNPNKMISIGGDFYSTYPFDDESPWLYADPQVEKVGYSGETDADADWDYILIGPGGQGEGLWKHNVGDPGVFYGGDDGAKDSTLTLILNPRQNDVCYFDNLDLRTESTSSGIDVPDDIFYRLIASNNYQEITRELNFNLNPSEHTGTIKRIGRVWRTPIMPSAPSDTSYSRMVDTYLKLTLKYDNSSGNTFRVHDVELLYRPARN